jgi:Ca-activated chloride channel family protein
MKKGLILLFACFTVYSSQAQITNDYKGRKTRLLFLLDGSGSMVAAMDKSTRWSIAVDLMSRMVDSLRNVNDLEVGLRVFGHTVPITRKDCYDTKLEVPFGPHNHKLFKNALRRVMPLGYTSITESILASAEDFPKDDNARNVLVIITDGVEECGGDPCAVSAALQKKGIILKPFIVGIGSASDEFRTTYSCAGTFFNAQTREEFDKIMGLIISSALNATTAQISLLDNQGKPLETNVPVSVYSNTSGQIVESWIHTLNGKNNPDTIFLDPVLTYNIEVHTTPKIIKRNVALIPGRHNTIAIDAAQGDIFFKIKGVTRYGRLPVLVSKGKQTDRITIQDFNTKKRYLVGNYDVEILTVPPTVIKGINVKQNRTTTVEIASPGKLQLTNSADMVASVFTMKQGSQTWVADIPQNAGRYDLTMQPGRYQIIYRSKNETRMIYSKTKDFKITSLTSTYITI